MVFSSNIFLFAFLPLVIALYFLIPDRTSNNRIKNTILLITSLIFYSWGETYYIVLLLRFGQFCLSILVLCLCYTAVIIDAAQRIGIIIFALTTLSLIYIFNYYKYL